MKGACLILNVAFSSSHTGDLFGHVNCCESHILELHLLRKIVPRDRQVKCILHIGSPLHWLRNFMDVIHIQLRQDNYSLGKCIHANHSFSYLWTNSADLNFYSHILRQSAEKAALILILQSQNYTQQWLGEIHKIGRARRTLTRLLFHAELGIFLLKPQGFCPEKEDYERW